MHNQSNVRSFFERMSSAVTVKTAPPLELLHTKSPVKLVETTQSASYVPAEVAGSSRSRVSSMQWEIVDYGVGLPPLAGC